MSETAQRANADLLDFCPGCFATNEDGSWGHTCDDHDCYNCGAQGTVKLPRWAVRSIREQASWVGKRYYPHDEDRQAAEEIAALREIAPPAAPEAPQPVEPECPHTLIRHTYTAGETEVRTACVWCGKPIVLVSDPPIDPPAARQPGADAEHLRNVRDWIASNAPPSEAHWMTAAIDNAIARLSAPARAGSEGGEVERVCRRCRLPEREHRPGYAAHRCAGWVPQDAIAAARQPGTDAELVERLREALERIVRWSEAYPVDIFPEPDLKTARVLLEAGGITLDAVSASAMRHVVSGVGQIARAALEASGADHHDAGTGESAALFRAYGHERS